MSVSRRRFRARVLEYVDAGTSGAVDSTYLTVASDDADELWWCSRIAASGREVTTGMQPDHRVEYIFGFAAEVPVTNDGAIICEGESFKITAILSRDYGRDEVQVLAERVAELALSTA